MRGRAAGRTLPGGGGHDYLDGVRVQPWGVGVVMTVADGDGRGRGRDSLVQRATDWVFGHDFFISYSHRDGKTYPLVLREKLERAGFRCFLDQKDYTGGTNLKRETRRQVSKSDVIVVVGRAGALASKWVAREVEIALSHAKDPVVIDVNGALAAAKAGEGIVDTVREEHWLRLEEALADAAGRPVGDGPASDATVSELVRTFRHTRQETKRARILAAVAAVLALAAVAATWQWTVAIGERKVAEAKEREAQRERIRAEINNQLLLARRADALAEAGDATAAGLVALESARAIAALAGRIDRTGEPALVQEHRAASDEAQRALYRGLHGRRELAVLRGAGGDTSAVKAVAISPSGRRVAVGRASGAVQVHSHAGALAATMRHAGPIDGLAFSPNGERLLTWSSDGTARQWSVETGAEIAAPMRHAGGVRHAAYDAAGARIVTAGADRAARVWRADDASPVATLAGHTGGVNHAAFSRDGRLIATASNDHDVRLWSGDLSSSRVLAGPGGKSHQGAVRTVDFSPDGQRLVSASVDKTAILWDLADGASKPLRGHDDTLFGARFGPTGNRIVTFSEDFSARLWHGRTGELLSRVSHSNWVVAAEFNASGRSFLTASHDNRVRIWSTETGELEADLAGHHAWEGWGLTATYAPDGSVIATGSWDGTARLWQAQAGAEVVVVEPGQGEVLSAAFSHDGALVATGASGTQVEGFLDVWDAETGLRARPRVATQGRLWALAAHPARPLLAAASGADRKVVLLDAASGRRDLLDHDEIAGSGQGRALRAVGFSGDGTRIASGGQDGRARLWDAAALTPIGAPFELGSAVQDLALDLTGARLAAGGDGGTLRIWRTGDRAAASFAHRRETIQTTRFSRDGRRLLVSTEGGWIDILDVTETPPRTLWSHRLSGQVWAAAWSPDERLVVAGNLNRRATATVLEPASGRTIAVLRGHTGGIRSVSFSPDGSRILTSSSDRTARVWPMLPDAEALSARFAGRVPRCLGRTERARLGLPEAPPEWCITGWGNEKERDSGLWLAKWPYDGAAWKAWLVARRHGEEKALPPE